MASIAPYGSWESPITPAAFALGNCKSITELNAGKGGVFYVEQSATTGKRELYFHSSNGRERWAPQQSVQNAVHEYGGGAFTPIPDGGVVYSTVDGVFEQKSSDTLPRQLADGVEKTFRFADFAVTPTHIFCVNESHQEKGADPINRIISINRETKEQKVIASGADFYACPRVSPDGLRLSWMQWNHNNMPWDETSIHIAVVNKDGTVDRDVDVVVKDGRAKNINYCYPNWASNDVFYVVHDATNVWNLYHVFMGPDFPEVNVYPSEKEIGIPHWVFGNRPYAANSDKLLMVVSDHLVYRQASNTRTIATPGFSSFSHPSISEDGTLYVIASGPKKSSSVLAIRPSDDGNDSIEVLRQARDDLDSFDISEPIPMTFNSDGELITGFFYKPLNNKYKAPDGTLPPVILLGHGGPTGNAYTTFDIKKQFFTSRGFALFDVDYRGSTGYGTRFRNLLKREWGVVDTRDVINGANMLIENKLVDKDKVCIMGSSAGGYLLLSALMNSDVFKAAVSIYGVADLVGLAKDTHKFERGYNEVLIGKYPEERHIYEERSPINHLDKLNTPIAFLHGKEDTVVPFSQSVQMYEAMKDKGVVTALQLYENEGHGFRGAEAVRKSNESAYYFLCKALGIEPSIRSELEIVNLKSRQ